MLLAAITVSAVGVSLLIGFVLPVVNGIINRPGSPPAVKAVTGIAIAGVAAIITNAVRDDGTAMLSWEMVTQFWLIYGPQIAAYLGLWKQVDVNARTGPGLI